MRMRERWRRGRMVVMLWVLLGLALGAGGGLGRWGRQALAAVPPPLVLSLEECIMRALAQNP
ncbi:MAG: hypothetical protein D6736_12205, partial [Nitrospinota bacterium]